MSINVTVSGGSSVNVTTSSSNLLNLSAQGYTLHANTHENGGVDPIDHNLLRNIQGGQSNEYYHLTSGQYTNLSNIISSTGNYTLHSETGAFYASSNPSGFITGVNLTSYATTGYVTGASGILQNQITTLNNQTGSYYPRSNPSGFITGVNLSAYTLHSETGAFYAASNPSGFITGVNLSAYTLHSETGAFYAASNPSGFITGVNLASYATTGYVTGASGILQTQINTLNNQTGNYYPRVNPSGYITGISNLVYATGDQTISGVKTFATGVNVSGNISAINISGNWSGSTIPINKGGTNATTANSAVTNITTIVNSASSSIVLSNTDSGTIINCTGASAITITVPTGLTSNFSVMAIQGGSGRISFTGSGGSVINSFNNNYKIAGQYGAASLIMTSPDVFNLAGNTSAT